MENDISQRPVRLYDSHSGLGGALMPLPLPMKQAAARMNGTSMSLEKAVSELTQIAEKIGGKIRVVEEKSFISFSYSTMTPFGEARHFYRLIRYKEEP